MVWRHKAAEAWVRMAAWPLERERMGARWLPLRGVLPGT
jgi:hypothetical protein